MEFKAGQEIDILTDDELDGDSSRLTCNYKSLPTTVKPGDEILIDGGNLVCKVLECLEDYIKVECLNDFTVDER